MAYNPTKNKAEERRRVALEILKAIVTHDGPTSPTAIALHITAALEYADQLIERTAYSHER